MYYVVTTGAILISVFEINHYFEEFVIQLF